MTEPHGRERTGENVMQHVYLLTYHGSILARSPIDRRLHAIALSAVEVKTELVCCEFEGSDIVYLQGRRDISVFSPDRYTIKRFPNSRTVSLERASRYLRAWPGGEVDWHAFSAAGWEEFLILTEAEVDILLRLARNDWVAPRTANKIGRSRVIFLNNFQAMIGDINLDFRLIFPVCCDPFDANKIVVYQNGWIAEEIRLFRPLVYYVSFGAPKYLEMAVISMKSWALFHDFSVTFLIITDITRDALLAVVPSEFHSNLKVWTIRADETFEYCLQRYRIAEWPESNDFQPLLYLDTDVMFDAEFEDKLVELLLSDKIFVAHEAGAMLESTPSVGSQLVEKDPHFDGAGLPGFNSGTIGVPNARDYRVDLRAIGEVMVRYATLADGGRLSLHWFDQACANYVLAKREKVSGSFTDTMSFVGHGEKPHVPPRGLAHFWGGSDKLSIMSDYFKHLQNVQNESGRFGSNSSEYQAD